MHSLFNCLQILLDSWHKTCIHHCSTDILLHLHFYVFQSQNIQNFLRRFNFSRWPNNNQCLGHRFAAPNAGGGRGCYYGSRQPLIMLTDTDADRWSVERIKACRDGNGNLAMKISATLLESECGGSRFDSHRDMLPTNPAYVGLYAPVVQVCNLDGVAIKLLYAASQCLMVLFRTLVLPMVVIYRHKTDGFWC